MLHDSVVHPFTVLAPLQRGSHEWYLRPVPGIVQLEATCPAPTKHTSTLLELLESEVDLMCLLAARLVFIVEREPLQVAPPYPSKEWYLP